MAFSDSMFLFEVVVEKLKSFIKCKTFLIKGQFADIFSLELRDPNESDVALPGKNKRKRKTTRVTKAPLKQHEESRLQCGQSILLEHNADKLKTRMMDFPIELSLWSSLSPEDKLGSTQISWSQTYLDYLNLVNNNRSPAPVSVSGDYNVFDEVTSKRMATISLRIKLSHLKNCINQSITSILDNKLDNNVENPTEFVKLSYLKQCINQPIISILDKTLENNMENRTESMSFICNKQKKYEKIDTGLIENYIENPTESISFIGNKRKKYEKIDTGIVKAKYVGSGKKHDKNLKPNKNKTKEVVNPMTFHKETKYIEPVGPARYEKYSTEKNLVIDNDVKIKGPTNKIVLRRISTSLVNILKSEPRYENIFDLASTKSCTSTKYDNKLNPYRYIFGDQNQSYGNKVYCVGYFTVQNVTSASGPSEVSKTPEKKETTAPGQSEVSNTSGKNETSAPGPTEVNKAPEKKETPASGASQTTGKTEGQRYKLRICDNVCPGKKHATETDNQSHISLDLPVEGTIAVKKCDTVDCAVKKHRQTQPEPDERILIGVDRPRITEKVEVVGGIDAKIKFGDDPCYCTCECTFGFTKKTTYCNVCGGYEIVGEEVVGKEGQLPFPCPIFHKLDKNKSKTSNSGSDSKRTMKGSKTEPEKPIKKGKKKATKDDRFKFNYGYEGIPPHIGHSFCAMPCRGTLSNVPKNMGWLWTAEDVLGMKFRPLWKPGAVNKHVLRLLRMARNPGQILTKKRRRDTKPKKSLIRPLLVVHKKDGEYTVTMETMKTYAKPRAINQQPYEDKPVITYTIGRTEEENLVRQKKREREQRRLERMQRHFIQSAFRDMCHEICLKTYQQALGILPNAESPDCPCFPAHPDSTHANLDVSCSCSEDQSVSGSDTDSDEWIVEFTPPNAKFDPKFKSKKVVKVDNCSQYNYLDYKVKLLDRYGNPVPRFFKGPDGKQVCSDLGGFWSPEHKWLVINVDGYVAPDGRWAPNTFYGPGAEFVDAETGKFQTSNGKWYIVGVDGYVDAHNKWHAYPKPRQAPQTKKRAKGKGGGGDKITKPVSTKPSEATFSCFGDISPRYLNEMGIMGHGPDKKILLAALKDMRARGEDVKIREPSPVPRLEPNKGKKAHTRIPNVYDARTLKCHHPEPSPKGVTAVNPHGDKVYFKLHDPKNPRPKQRLADLDKQGISLSSFHVPCFHSFINSEMMKQQLKERILASQSKAVATQAGAGAHWGNTQVAQGWRPGAVSKGLLRKLKRAKEQKSSTTSYKKLRKAKKRSEVRPGLVISKIDGEYRVEMQMTNENPDGSDNQNYSPLIYKIKRPDNEERLMKRERKAQRLVKKAVGNWPDPFHPEYCERTCLRAYKQAMGILPYDPNNPDCTCEETKEEEEEEVCSCCNDEDDDDSSDCSSLDLDWEIHFTPPSQVKANDDKDKV